MLNTHHHTNLAAPTNPAARTNPHVNDLILTVYPQMAPSLRRIVARELQRIWNRPDDESVTPISVWRCLIPPTLHDSFYADVRLVTARHALQHVNLRVEDSALLLALTVAIQLREVGQDFGEYAGLTATDDDVRILTSQRKRYADLAVFSLTWIISVLAGVVGYHFYLVLQSGGLGGECRAFGG